MPQSGMAVNRSKTIFKTLQWFHTGCMNDLTNLLREKPGTEMSRGKQTGKKIQNITIHLQKALKS